MERYNLRRANIRRTTIVLLIIFSIMFGGCTQKFEAFRPAPIEVAPPEVYSVQEDLDRIPRPTRIKRMYGRIVTIQGVEHLEFVDNPNDADFFIIAPEEYAKVTMLKELAKTYKAIIYKQEDLVNVKNATIQEYQRLLALVEQERDLALGAWENSENAYRQEVKAHKTDNLINKAGMWLITIGAIVLVASGL